MSTRRSRRSPPKKINSWVRPGVFEVRASARRPVSALMSDDLPTLDRPAKAISGPAIGGSDWSELSADRKFHSPANRRRPASISAWEKASITSPASLTSCRFLLVRRRRRRVVEPKRRPGGAPALGCGRRAANPGTSTAIYGGHHGRLVERAALRRGEPLSQRRAVFLTMAVRPVHRRAVADRI